MNYTNYRNCTNLLNAHEINSLKEKEAMKIPQNRRKIRETIKDFLKSLLFSAPTVPTYLSYPEFINSETLRKDICEGRYREFLKFHF